MIPMHPINELADFVNQIDGEVGMGVAILIVVFWFGFIAFHGY